MTHDITQGDILDWAARYDGPLFHAALMDAPYEEEFMGKGWDNTGIALNPETWKAIARCLYPGAFLLVFAGTLNDDLISVAMRQAGLRKYHRGAAWVYGSGFPKATQISPQIDRAAGAIPTVIGTRKHAPKWAAADLGYREKDNGYNSKTRESFDVTSPATPLAQAWEGHRYGGQMLKPALESILIFQKPYQGKPIECITRTGAGAINIDAGRIGTDELTQHGRKGDQFGFTSAEDSGRDWAGRWPSNLVLSHHPECNGTCHEACPVRRLGEQSGESGESEGHSANGVYGTYDRGKDGTTWQLNSATPNRAPRGDSGTAARFFFNADYALDRLEQSEPLIYVPKASTAEREAGLADFKSATVGDGRQTPINNAYQRGETIRRNIHPTVKPISLVRHLATLLLPPDLYAPRRLLLPFSGAGSEMIGAMLAGWEDVQGVELEAEYVAIARARIAFWQQMKYKLMNPDTPVKVKIDRKPDGQLDMFEAEQTQQYPQACYAPGGILD